MGDFQIDFYGDVFSRRCEEQKGDGVPLAETGEHNGGRVCN